MPMLLLGAIQEGVRHFAYSLGSLQERHFKNIAGGSLQSVADTLQPMLNALSQVRVVGVAGKAAAWGRVSAAGAARRLC